MQMAAGLTAAFTVALLTLSIAASGGTGDRPQSAASEFPPLRGPNPNAQVVAISPDIASPDDPVFYVRHR